MTDPAQVRRSHANAEATKAAEPANAFERPLFELNATNYGDLVQRRLSEAVAAYEETSRAKHSHVQAASYARRMIAAKVPIPTLTDWALSDRATRGLETRVNGRLAEFTGEYFVAEFPERFSIEAVTAPKMRLRETFLTPEYPKNL